MRERRAAASASTRAEDGNVALSGELETRGGELVLALGYGRSPEEAAHQARASLAEGFDALLDAYTGPWRRWHAGLWRPPRAAALRHQRHGGEGPPVEAPPRRHPGEPGRAVGLLQGGRRPRRLPPGLAARHGRGGRGLAGGRRQGGGAGGPRLPARPPRTQDGHWPQNMWAEGRPYWEGVQMDETALPILLVDLARRAGGAAGGRPRGAGLLADGPAGGRLPGAQRPGHPAGPLGGGRRLHALHAGGRDRGAAGGRRPGGAGRRAGAGPLPARDRRRLERPHRALALRAAAPSWPAGSASTATTCASPRRASRRATRPGRAEEPPARRGGGPVGRHRQHRRAGAGPLRPARRRRSADPATRSGPSTRCSGSRRPSARPGTATTATATASTRTAAPSTAPGSAGPGRCSPGSGRTTPWPRATGPRPSGSSPPWRRWPARAASCRSRPGTPPTSPSGSSSSAARPARPCRWSGPTPST